MPEKQPLPDLFVETQPCPLPSQAPAPLDLDLDFPELPVASPPKAGFLVADAPVASKEFAPTDPGSRPAASRWVHQKALVVHDNPAERIHWRARMALANLVWVDEATTTAQALTALDTHQYSLVVVSCECPTVDPVAVVEAYHEHNERGLTVVTGVSPEDFPLGAGDDSPPLQAGWRGKLRSFWKGEDLQSRFHHSTAFSAGHFAHQLMAPLNPADMDAVLREWGRRLRR
jgi:CheY-like chemotaxis protein